MSKAAPLTTNIRESHYLAQTGRTTLTARQARRIRHKENEAVRVVPVRIGRLRRRYDRKDQARVQADARRAVAGLRNLLSYSRFAPKPDSKRQVLRRRQSR